MEQYKKEFIEFMVDCQVLKFGEFTLKSGRKSPFFMNAGAYVTGSQLMGLGEYYAKAIHNTYGDDFDVLFGPAYKGIPISVVTAIAYSKLYGKEVRYCSDRKEEKDHGADKGSFLGSKLKDGDRVIMIEDVTTSGKSMEETVPKVRGAADVEIVGLMVSLDRCEKGLGGEKRALEEVQEKYHLDALMEFHPIAGRKGWQKKTETFVDPACRSTCYDVNDFIQNRKYILDTKAKVFPGLFPNWDNSPRRYNRGAWVLQNTPENYKKWLADLIQWTNKNCPKNERFIFVNAWNEWAECAHLEPDTYYGYAFLQKTREALEESVENKEE